MRTKHSLATAGLLLMTATPAVAEMRTIEVEPFTSVSISSGLIGIVSEGPVQSVTAEAANAAVLNRLDVDVRNGRLEIGIEWDLLEFLFSLGQRPQITVRVVAPAISEVEANAGANVDVVDAPDVSSLEVSSGASLAADDLAAATLSVSASSGASLALSGTCDRLVAEASSGASVRARDLRCTSVNADASSGASLTVWADDAAEADASTGASIAIHGNPESLQLDSSTGGSTNVVP